MSMLKNFMICSCCFKDHPEKDFFSNTQCFRCVYQNKLLSKIKRAKKPKKCKVCKKEIIHDELIKKRQRTTYCGEECALNGHKVKMNNYWTKKLKANFPLAPWGHTETL